MSPVDSGFGLDNLPYGSFDPGDGRPRLGVRFGDRVVDLSVLSDRLPGDAAPALAEPTLNGFLALGRSVWQETRSALQALLVDDPGAATHYDIAEVRMVRPFDPGDYVDFYSSLEHATNLGKMFRPDGDPLLPNWRHLPVGYHGRASSVVVSGTPIRRPHGQTRSGDDDPVEGPTRALDIELEVGFVTGPGNDLGSPISVDDAGDHIFGLVLVNDWSARDIQRWEYQPLGPFLGKSFATSVSPWVVTLEALLPYLKSGPVQEPEPLPYLQSSGDWGVDIDLEVELRSEAMSEGVVVTRVNFAGMYWTMAQQLAHATVNGTNVRPGDLYASGTVSGAEPGSYGSLIEATRGGRDPIDLPDGTSRAYLEDGDTVVLRGVCSGEGQPTISFGECVGTVLPAIEH